MILDIPNDLLYDVACALEHRASVYRDDVAHDPEDVATLQRDAGRLDAIAAFINTHRKEAP